MVFARHKVAASNLKDMAWGCFVCLVARRRRMAECMVGDGGNEAWWLPFLSWKIF